jgi:hypothetical protein
MYLAVLPLGNSPRDAQCIAFAAENRVDVAAALQIFGTNSALVIAFLTFYLFSDATTGLFYWAQECIMQWQKTDCFSKIQAGSTKQQCPQTEYGYNASLQFYFVLAASTVNRLYFFCIDIVLRHYHRRHFYPS